MSTYIANQHELKVRISELWPDIGDSCRGCSDPDCMGYIWLTDTDAGLLMREGHGVVRVNPPDGPRFIDSYSRDSQGYISVQTQSPRCPFLDDDRRCSIHSIRPLVCHFYPLSLETFHDGSIVWALHRNCNHIRRIESNGELEQLIEKIVELLDSMSPTVRSEVLSSHQMASLVSQPVSDHDAACLTLIRRT